MTSDLELAVAVARVGGRAALAHFRQPLASRNKRSPSDPVSLADLEAQAAMVNLLRAARPLDGIVAEEDDLVISGRRQWLLDPLDGTVAFLAEQPSWSVALCLREEDETLLSVVFDPVSDELFVATRDEGVGVNVNVNGLPLELATTATLREAVVRTWCDPHVAAHRDYLPTLGRLAERAGVVIAGGSGSLAMAQLAAGRIDGWLELYPAGVGKDWDWYPGQLLVTAAGGVTGQLGPWRWATTPALASELKAVLSNH